MIDVLYIAGSGRSGSTLLERILGQMDGVITVGELRHLWKRVPERELCGCGQLIAECPFWTEALARASIQPTSAEFAALRDLQQQVDRIRHMPTMLGTRGVSKGYDRRAEEYSAILTRLYGAIREVGNGQFIVDSSKDISTLYLLTTMDEIRLRVLQLVRDSRAVAFSWMRQRVRPHVVDQISYMPVYSPEKSALDWTYRNLLSGMVRSRTDSYMLLRYEDLMAAPQQRLIELTKFFAMGAFDSSIINGNEVILQRDSHTVSGNPMRFEKGRVQFKLDSAWQEQLKDSDRRIVTLLTWPLLRKYGYDYARDACVPSLKGNG